MAAAPHITAEQFNALMAAEIPLSTFLGITVLEVGAGTALLWLPFTPAALRPGGVQSGPALMALADLAMYAAVMGLYGHEPRVLSSDLSMNFLRRAPDQALLGRCTVLGLDTRRAPWPGPRSCPMPATAGSCAWSRPTMRCPERGSRAQHAPSCFLPT